MVMLTALFRPAVNLRRWIAQDYNPCAPTYNRSVWNDGGSITSKYKNKYRVEIDYLKEINKDPNLKNILTHGLGLEPSQVCFYSFYFSPDKISKKFSIGVDTLPLLQELGKRFFSNIQFTNNCYSYMWNDPVIRTPGDKPQPGYKSGCAQYWDSTLDDILERLDKDGAQFAGYTLPSIKDDYYRAVLMTSNTPNKHIEHLHFRREDNDGLISEKWGHHRVSRAGLLRSTGRDWEKPEHSCKVYGYLQIPSH